MKSTARKFFQLIEDIVGVITSLVRMLTDWINYLKELSDHELELQRKEAEVDMQIRLDKLDKELKERLKDAGIHGPP